MLRGIDAEVRQRLKPPAFDVAVALLFVAVGQTDVWMPWGDGTPAFDGPQWATCALILAATAPLAWRRRAPLLVAATVIVALVIAVQVSETALFLGGYVPVAVAAYTVAAYGSRARAVLGIAILCLGVLVVTLSIPELRNPGQVVFELPFLATVWIVGRLVHRLRTRAHALTRQAETLERRRDHEARAAVDLERARIARELHDVIAHSVSLMGIQAAAAEQVLALDPERAREPLQAIQNTARDAIDELRRLLGVLRDSGTGIALGPQPGLAALDALVEQMRGAGLAVELRVEGEVCELSPGVELSAYRVVQEALTNVLKHAGEARTTVVVRHRPDALELEIADDGGREGNGDGTGHGLIGMRERVALYGGTLASGRPRRRGLRRARVAADTRGPRVIRVVIADDMALVRGGLRMILDLQPDIDVVAEAADGREAIEAARLHRPDVLLMDIRMPGLDGIEATRRLLAGNETTTRVLMLTTFNLDEYVYDAMKAGASGFLLKNTPPGQLAEAVRAIARGDALLAPDITRRLIEEHVRGPRIGSGPPEQLAELTDRELDVLRLVARGNSNAEIAEALCISEGTVKTHISRILSKLGLRDRVQAVVAAYESGLVRAGRD